ncbi:MAG: zinc-dependent alcohol dehydrogenase family protein [Candidatus Korobacteraceae bacterium]
MNHAEPYHESAPLSIEDLDVSGPGPGQVLVEVAAAGLCHSDLSVINGSRPRAMPMVLGHEASGIVRETGPGVRDLSPGDHIIFSYMPACGYCLYCATGRPALCENGAKANASGTLLDGKRHFKNSSGQELHHHLGVSAFSQYTVVAQESVVRIDRDLRLDIAALFGCAVMTGVGAVLNTAQVEAGASVAIFGLGGVGLSALLGAAAAGANPIIAVDSLPSKLELAKSLGATARVLAGTEETASAIRDLSQGGADYVFECVGNEKALIQAYQVTRRGGTTITVGLAAPDRQFTIPAVSLVTEERTVKGSYMGSAVPKRDIPRFISMYRAGRLPVDCLLSRTIALEDLNPAFDALHRGEVVRQVVRFANSTA